MSLRTFDEVEQDALQQRVRKTWATLRDNDFPAEVRLPALLQGFGDWRRVAPPVNESFHRVTVVLFRSASSDEYALLSLPYQYADTAVDAEDMHVLLDAAREAVVGDFLRLWRWTLDASPPMGQAAMMFVQRLPVMPEEIAFLAAFSLVEETYRAAAEPKRSALFPMQLHTKGLTERLFWEATEAGRERVTTWALDEVSQFVRSLTDRAVALDEDTLRVEVEHLLEVFLDEQHAFDPTGERRVPFVWASRSE